VPKRLEFAAERPGEGVRPGEAVRLLLTALPPLLPPPPPLLTRAGDDAAAPAERPAAERVAGAKVTAAADARVSVRGTSALEAARDDEEVCADRPEDVPEAAPVAAPAAAPEAAPAAAVAAAVVVAAAPRR